MDGLVLQDDMPEFAADFAIMKKYDEFFQHRVFGNTVAPELQFSEDWTYAVVNFQGWMYRTIPLVTARAFTEKFGSHFVVREVASRSSSEDGKFWIREYTALLKTTRS